MKCVVITGATGGLGRELTRAFARRKDALLLAYHQDKERAQRLAEESSGWGAEALLFQADLRVRPAVRDMARAAVKAWGKIDVWINNAALTVDRPLTGMEEETWDDIISVNLRGTFFGLQEAASAMIPFRDGHIINIGSLAGLKGSSGQAAYAASKAGIIGLTKSAARELGNHNVRINAVLPGVFRSGMTGGLSDRRFRRLISENVLERESDPEEVSRFVCLLSEMKSVSGQVFNLDSRIF